MSRDKAINQIWDSAFNEEGDELGRSDLESAYDAGYRKAREDAAKRADQYLRMEENRHAIGQRVAAEIRKLEPSNLASEQKAANSRQD